MKHLIPLLLTLSLSLVGCFEGSNPQGAQEPESSSSSQAEVIAPVKVDYSKGRAMNKRLGKGINLGNAWDAACYYGSNIPSEPYNYGKTDRLDSCWSNPIKDEYFPLIKKAGFNSVRIPVRWQHNSNPETHEVNPDRLAGVMEDVQLAFDNGLAVVISFHWYYELMEAAESTDKNVYEKEKEHFLAIWTQVAAAFEEKFPGSDSLLVWDLLNEPTMPSKDRLNDAMLSAFEAIRKVAPGKTIMFESYHAAKFADIGALKLPEDGNIIFSGHYYEPYTYSHQGHSDIYSCKGDEAFGNTAKEDFLGYVRTIKKLYPDVNGNFVPTNMGEFGVSGGPGDACARKGEEGPSEANKAQWAKATIEAAEAYGISWHYWGLVGVGGFEAYDKTANKWYTGFPAAFGLQ